MASGALLRGALVLAFALALGLFVLAGVASFRAARQAQDGLGWVAHSQRVQAGVAQLEREVLRMETDHRAYLLTGDPVEARDRDAAFVRADAARNTLWSLTGDNPEQRRRLAAFAVQLAARRTRMADTTRLLSAQGLAAAQDHFRPEGPGTLTPLLATLDALRLAEADLLAARQSQAQRQSLRLRQAVVWAPLLGAIVLVGGLLVVFRLWRRGERLLVELAQRDAEARRALELVDATGDAVITYDAQSLRIGYANLGACRQLAYQRDDLLGRSILDIKTELDAAGFTARLATLRDGTAEALTFDTSHRQKDGSELPVEVSIRYAETAGGQPTFVSVARDLSERQRVEAEIDRFFTLSLDMLCVANPSGRFERVSPAFTATLGWSAEELTSRPFVEFVHPDDVEATLREVDRQVRDGQPVLNFENRYRHKDGGWRILSWRSQPGSDGRMFATARDVTERSTAEAALRESESRLRTVIDVAYDAFVVMDGDGRIGEWSRRAEETFGWTAAEAVGRQVGDLIVPPDQRDAHRFGLARYMATGRSRMLGRAVEVMARHRDGRDFPVEITISPIRRGGSLIFGAFLRDISERRRSEARIAALNRGLAERSQALEAANRELEAFSYSVSHDLRAPLRHVAGYARMLAEDCADKLDADGRRHLDAIADSARRMGQLIDDLLALARLGRKPVEARPLAMRELVEEVVAELAPAQGVVIVRELPDASGDPVLLRQLWLNLLSNAIKYSAPRGAAARVEITGEILPGQVRYRVRDNGVGFDMRYADKLFGVFQRLHSPDQFEGTGVGLAIVQRIVTRHGGTIRAEAEPDRGATFTFELPRKEDQP